MEFLTIYTDASICPKTKVGGWACWMKFGPRQKLTYAKPFRELVHDSTEAEMKAIANALAIAVKHFSPENCVIVITTDSQNAIGRITRKRVKGKPHLQQLTEVIHSLVPPTCEIRMKKVKAHSKGDGRRSYVNGIVDKAARREMRLHRDSLTPKEN